MSAVASFGILNSFPPRTAGDQKKDPRRVSQGNQKESIVGCPIHKPNIASTLVMNDGKGEYDGHKINPRLTADKELVDLVWNFDMGTLPRFRVSKQSAGRKLCPVLDQMLNDMPTLKKEGLLANNQFRKSIDDGVLPNYLAPIKELYNQFKATGKTQEKAEISVVLRDLFRDYQYALMGYLFEGLNHGEKQASRVVPKAIAEPLLFLSEIMGQHPWLEYASGYVIANSVFPENGPVNPKTVGLVRMYHGGDDERYFQTIHSAIEFQTTGLLTEIGKLMRGPKTTNEVLASLKSMTNLIGNMREHLHMMPKLSDNKRYAVDVRTQIQGLYNNEGFFPRDLFFETTNGTQSTQQGNKIIRGRVVKNIHGQTGAQSSIVPLLDYFYNTVSKLLDQKENDLSILLARFHKQYRPAAHSSGFESVQNNDTLRAIQVQVKSNPVLLKEWSKGMLNVLEWRFFHYNMVMNYIVLDPEEDKGVETQKKATGTGGTDTPKYLPNNIRVSGIMLKTQLEELALAVPRDQGVKAMLNRVNNIILINEQRVVAVEKYLNGDISRDEYFVALVDLMRAADQPSGPNVMASKL